MRTIDLRDTSSPGTGGLEEGGDGEETLVLTGSGDQLDRQRQAGGVEAARQTDRRIAGQIEWHGVGVPGGTNVLDALIVDLDRAEKVLVDRQSWPGQSRHGNDVGGLEPRLDLAIQAGAGENRLVQFGGAV